MTAPFVLTYIFFYFFSRIKIAYQETNDDAEEFANRIALIPFFIEMVAVSIVFIELIEKIIGKPNNHDD